MHLGSRWQASREARLADRPRKRAVGAGARHRLVSVDRLAPFSNLTQVRQAGLVEALALTPGLTLLADAGYQELGAQTAGAVPTPRPARRKNQLPILPALAPAHEAERRAHSAQRIRAEHGISHLKNWRALSRHLGRREHLDTMLRAVAGLVASPETSPTTRTASPPIESPTGRHRRVIKPALTGQ